MLSCLSWSWGTRLGLLPRYRPVSPQVQKCLQQFKVTGAQLRQIQARLLGSMERELSGQASPAPTVRMLPTYVGSTPHGTGGCHSTRLVVRLGERALIWGRGKFIISVPISKVPISKVP